MRGLFECSVAQCALMLSGSVVAGTLLFCLSVGVLEGEPQEMPSLRGAVAPSWCTSQRDAELFALLTSKASQLEKAEFFCINGEPSGVGGKDKALWSVLGLRNQLNLDWYFGLASYSAAGEFIPIPARGSDSLGRAAG